MKVKFKIEYLVLLFALFLVCFQLFRSPILGLADNGDFAREMSWEGIHYQTDSRSNYKLYVEKTYAMNPDKKEPLFGPNSYLSSEIVLLKPAIALNDLFGEKGYFDIRFLGFVHTLVFVFSLWLIFHSIRKLNPKNLVIYILLFGFMFLDVGFIAYFNSFYSEIASFLFLLLTIGCFLYSLTLKKGRFWMMIPIFILGSLFAIGKSQNSSCGVFLGIFAIRYSFTFPSIWKKIASVLMAFVIVFISYFGYSQTPDWVKQINTYNSLFVGILKNSPAPAEDLKTLHVNPSYEKYIGIAWYDSNSPTTQPGFVKAYLSQTSMNELFKFLINHPQRLYSLAYASSKQAFSIHPDFLGNYEKANTTIPKERSYVFATWGLIKDHILPKNFYFISLFSLLFVVWNLYMRKKSSDFAFKMIFEFNICICFMCLSQLFVAIIGDGENDLLKHLYLFNFTFDLMLFVVISSFLSLLWSTFSKRLEKSHS